MTYSDVPYGTVPPDFPRQAFVRRVKEMDAAFKEGRTALVFVRLPALIALGRRRADLTKKTSHYLASLAFRSLERDAPRTALRFLDLADREVGTSHLSTFLLEERRVLRERAEQVTSVRL